MVIWFGVVSLGLVMGWVSAFLFHHNRPSWRAVKVTLGLLFGAGVQAVFGGIVGVVVYGVGAAFGAALYGVTLLVKPLRRIHEGHT